MTPYTERQQGSRLQDLLQAQGHVLSIALFFILCCAFFASLSNVFLEGGNILNILRQAAPNLIIGVAMTLVITTGGIDLSVGSIVALVNSTAAVLLKDGFDWPVVVLLMLIFGALIGLAQGFFIAYQKIPAFITTLAGLSAIRGSALVLTGGFSILIPPGMFLTIGRGAVFGVPYPAILGLATAALGYVVLHTTVYGRRVVAVGANAEAARRFGVPAPGTIASVYVLTGAASALAALVIAARLGSGSSNAAVGVELDVIAAVILGGARITGGTGTVMGTLLGVVLVTLINSVLILVGVPSTWQKVIIGAFILVAGTLFALGRRQ